MNIIVITIAMIVCECILALLFTLIAQQYYHRSGIIDLKSILKGIFERLFLTLFLFNGIHHALTFFSALKLATRLKHSETNAEESGKYNDYYLLGNLTSVAISFLYVCIWHHAGDIDAVIQRILTK
jgi:uncharacterized membrane protein